MAAQFQFVMRSGPNSGKIYKLEAPEIIIGRDAGNTIAISDAEVSRKHAKLSLEGSAYLIQDLGSTNGTFINGQRITSTQALNPGDAVSLGESIVLVYETAYDPNATVVATAPSPRTAEGVRSPAPSPAPVPTPTPVPAPVYSGQVPVSPLPAAVPPAKKKKKFPVWLVILIILLLLACACVGFFVVIDQFSLWCQVLPFLVPLISGGTCP